MLFTLYGDYILPRGGEIWVGTLIKLFAEFGLSEQAIRSALSRMSQKGWLQVKRIGNKSYYSLTDKGKRLLSEGAKLIYYGRQEQWDGKWYVLTYSIPENMRDVRNLLRKELAWLGYGMLSNATWMCPHDTRDEVKGLVHRLGVDKHVEIFVASHIGFSDGDALVKRCWDLASINRQYETFIVKYRPRFEAHRQRLIAGQGIEASECFVERFMLIHEYRKFPFIDPELPVELLPEGWLGGEAATLFREYHRLLAKKANVFFDSVFEPMPTLPSPGR
ncbi:MAG: phenylacetic acid degradation operon negative regulatory protein PaaX [Chloroflexi bacterium]|nr:phenylacetic acid degradation operon negative regulatory protein PaaX [Chloroflexota bacterium]